MTMKFVAMCSATLLSTVAAQGESTTAMASLENVSHASAGEQDLGASGFCQIELEVCGGHFHLPRPCCGGLHCEQAVGDKNLKICVKTPPPQPACIAESTICGTGGNAAGECCAGTSCVEIDGCNGTMKCVRETSAPISTPVPVVAQEAKPKGPSSWFCQKDGGACGGRWHLPRSCCGNSVCEAVAGDASGVKKCAAYSQCAAVGQTCGGLCFNSRPCCGAAECQETPEAPGSMTCVAPPPSQQPHHQAQHCVALGDPCSRGFMQKDHKCCQGKCRRKYVVLGEKRCM